MAKHLTMFRKAIIEAIDREARGNSPETLVEWRAEYERREAEMLLIINKLRDALAKRCSDPNYNDICMRMIRFYLQINGGNFEMFARHWAENADEIRIIWTEYHAWIADPKNAKRGKKPE